MKIKIQEKLLSLHTIIECFWSKKISCLPPRLEKLAALTGSVSDSSLTGISSQIPYVALSSISKGGNYYWIKALSLKISSKFDGVQFSTDGVLLIAHSYSANSYIVVFNLSNGYILSARRYSNGGTSQNQHLIKSIVISSGVSPMAYSLSNYFSSSSCTGQLLFKFDPLTFLSSPNWIKQTPGTTNCGFQGLAFGRTENLLYAFSWFNSFSTISLLDNDGNSKWQLSTPDGDPYYSNTLNFKEIDTTTDMVVATSGSSFINYNLIFHSSSPSTIPPYSVNTSKTFIDNTLSSDRKLYALYIIDKDNAISFLWQPSTSYLAKINFLTQQISYQRAFPILLSLRSAIFTSPTVYYAGYLDNWFFPDETSNFRTLSAYQSQVFSSDMTKTSCYKMPPIFSSTPIKMVSPSTKITQIQSSIYQSSLLTFLDDTQAYTTVDISQSNIYSSSSWCLQKSFTVNTVTQSKSSFSLEEGGPDQNLAIQAFSATLNCGTYANTWKKTGLDNADGRSLDAATDLMSVNSATGAIFVSSKKPAGTYIIKVLGTLPDLVTSNSAIFTITIKANTIPVFSTPLTDMTSPLMSSTTYIFPSITDPDFGATTSVSVVKDSATGSLPNFMTFATTSLTVYPKLMTEVKEYTMIVIITDTKDTKQYQFKIKITNQPPITTSTITSPFDIYFGKTNTYNLPSSKDPEGLPYTTTINSAPSYVILDSINQKLNINPTNCATDFAKQTVKIDLTDEQPSTTTYSINLQVNNQPPIFSVSTPLSNQAVMTNTIADYTIPCSDPEGCPLLYQTTPVLPFVAISGNQIKFTPDQTQNGTYAITISCTDNQKVSASAALNLIVYQPPKFNGPVIQQIDLLASNPANYSLPIFSGISDENINHSSTLPRYVTFNSPLYQFLPDRVSDLGLQTIKGSLCNTYTCINFTFNLNVTNDPPFLNGTIKDQVISRNTAISYFIPEAIDRERQNITFIAQEVSKTGLPGFIKFYNMTQEFLFEPTQQDVISNYKIQLVLNDCFGASQIYTFSVTLFNPPSITKPKNKMNGSNSSNSLNSATLAAYLNMLKDQKNIQTKMLTMEIVKVTQDQKASIKIKATNNQNAAMQEIIVLITNNSFELTVQQDSFSYKIQFQIANKDLENSLINLYLKYPSPSNLSLNSNDTLKLRTLQKFQKIKKQIQTILPENIESEAIIPQQAISTNLKAKLEQTIQGGRIAFTEKTPQNMAIGFLIQMVWIQLLDISFLATNSMLALTIPGIPSIIQAVMIKYIYFDILYTEFWFSWFMQKIGIDIDQVNQDEALNQQFSDNGFESKFFLKNAGSYIIFLALYIISWSIYSIVAILSLCSTRMNFLKEYIKSQLIWKQSLYFLMNQFPPLFLCSILNLQDLRFNGDTTVAMYSTYLSIIVVVICSIVLVLLLIKVWALTRKLDQESVKEFNKRYSPLTDSLKETMTQKLIYFWKPLNLLRWGITLAILTAIEDSPSFQILSLLILSIVQQCLIFTSSPFNGRDINIISIYNEVAVSLYLYVAILLSDFLETQINNNQELTDSLRLFFAWILTSLLIFTIFVNLVFTLIKIVAYMLRYLRKKFECCIRRVPKYQQNIDQIKNQYQRQKNTNHTSNFESQSSEVVTKFENDSFENIPQQYIVQKPKMQQNNKLIPIMNGQQEFFDMFEMRQ